MLRINSNNRKLLMILHGRIVEATGPLSFRVKLEDDRVWRCHQDHLSHRVTNPESTQISSPVLDGVSSSAEADLESTETPIVTENNTPPPEEPI